MARLCVVGVLLCAVGCLETEDPVFGPGGFAGNADGSTTTPGDSNSGNCADDAACADGKACTVDRCVEGICTHDQAAGVACEDGNKCTSGDSCSNKACQLGLVKNCDDNNPCTQDKCDGKTGKCRFLTAPLQGDPCDADGSVCTVKDSCQTGVCTKGKQLDCDDSNPCTTDSCNPSGGKGCAHTPNAASCSDGNPCTLKDTCKGAKPEAGSLKSCIDGDKCTTDSCDAKTGACGFNAKMLDGNSCDADSSVCTHADACKPGVCLPGKKLDCDDTNPCTADSCVAGAGKGSGCSHAAVTGPCDDGNKCYLAGDLTGL